MSDLSGVILCWNGIKYQLPNLAVLQPEANTPVVNGNGDADMRDESVARGGDEVAQPPQRHAAHTAAAATSLAGDD